jgi:AraC-like DNA-binding protein
MLYLTYRPKPPLSEFVALFWYYDGYTQPHAKERIMPDGSMQVVINLCEDEIKIYDPENPERFERYPGAAFCGPRSRFEVIDTATQASVIGIQFRPGGAARFLRMPLTELHDRAVPLDCLWGAAGPDFRIRVLEAPTPEAKLRVFEQCLLEQQVKPLERHPAVKGALYYIGRRLTDITVGDLTTQIGVGRRRFIQVFGEEIGLSPKLFCRIHRFQQVLRAVRETDQIDWADVALSCGYFDQAHFNHDFRAFSGITPSTYLKLRTQHLNHVPLVES